MDDMEPNPPLIPRRESKQSSTQLTLGDTVQKFRDFYTSILSQGGAQKLLQTFSQERELSQQMPGAAREMFLAMLKDIQEELLPGSLSENNLQAQKMFPSQNRGDTNSLG